MEFRERLVKGNHLRCSSKAMLAKTIVPLLVGLCLLSKDIHQVASLGWGVHLSLEVREDKWRKMHPMCHLSKYLGFI